MQLYQAALLALAMIAVLFALASAVEARGKGRGMRPGLRHAVYTLALGVYCSSWTFYGAVGAAAREGWTYLPIYIAPVILLLAAPRFLASLSRAVAEEKAMTVSDFIAARFGHDPVVARLVTAIALCGTIPYIALQLRSISGAFATLSGPETALPAMVAAAGLLALFAIRFGARRFEQAGRSEGLLVAIAFESVIKLAALAAIAVFAITLLADVPPARLEAGLASFGARFAPSRLGLEFVVMSVVSAMAVIALPRQFYIGLIQAEGPDDLPRARLGFAAYLAAMAVLVLPIAMVGSLLLPGRPADLYPLLLPELIGNHPWVAMAALFGGMSAAAAMVIVDSVALATMVSNDFVFVAVLQRGGDAAGEIGRRMLQVRAGSVVLILALALLWALAVSPRNSLASIGIVAFAAMAQFTPHLLIATYHKNLDPLAARVSLWAGLVLWAWTLGLPPVLPTPVLQALAGTVVDPLHLLGIGQSPPVVNGVITSLGVNLLLYALVSARRAPASRLPRLLRSGRQVTDLGELVELTASFVGAERAAQEFPAARAGTPVDRRSASRAQRLIAGVVGASSARALVASALAGGQMSLADVTRLLDDGGQSLRFSRTLLAATLENIEAGISVIDADLNLQAWNSRYEDLFDYPPGLVSVGVPVAELIRHNAKAGDFGPGEVEYHVAKRLDHMRRGHAHTFERRRRDGRVIKTVGGPMPGGGYVMSFSDITDDARVRSELERTLAELESRVADRTRELSEANQRLARATRDKTRFLAAASHDLLQPLHAARLFTAALERDPALPSVEPVKRIERAIVAAEELLRALLDISKLDAGGVQPKCETFALGPFISDIVEVVRPLAGAKGLELRVATLAGTVHTDPALLRSVVQNFLVNAVRYTPEGGVLVGVRQRGGELRIDVVDTGVGIPEDQREAIFAEFTRVGEVEAEGLGLGLAIADRIVRLLGGWIELASRVGRGSRFSVALPRHQGAAPVMTPAPAAGVPDGPLTVLVVDNDPAIVEATSALLAAMGHRPRGAATIAQGLERAAGVDLVLADYRLDRGENGLDLVAALRRERPGLACAMITADADAELADRAAALGVAVLAKPVPPAAIAALLASASVGEVEP